MNKNLEAMLRTVIPLIFVAMVFVWVVFGFVGVIVVIVLALAGWSIYTSFKKQLIINPMDGTEQIGNAVAGARRKIPYIIGAVILLVLFFRAFTIVGAGEIGVQVFWGKVSANPLYSGVHFINPLAHVVIFDARTQQYYMGVASDNASESDIDDPIRILTSEGLSVDLDISALYRVKPDRVTDIYKNVGVGYEDLIIRPEIRSIIRDTLAQYTAKDIYSEKRAEIVGKIVDTLRGKLDVRGIMLEDVLLRTVTLPPDLELAIQEKLRAEQESQRYDFVLEKEKKEADRKRIEAEGQRDYQTTITASLTNQFLYYQYINQLKDRQGTIYVPTDPQSGLPQFRGI